MIFLSNFHMIYDIFLGKNERKRNKIKLEYLLSVSKYSLFRALFMNWFSWTDPCGISMLCFIQLLPHKIVIWKSYSLHELIKCGIPMLLFFLKTLRQKLAYERFILFMNWFNVGLNALFLKMLPQKISKWMAYSLHELFQYGISMLRLWKNISTQNWYLRGLFSSWTDSM